MYQLFTHADCEATGGRQTLLGDRPVRWHCEEYRVLQNFDGTFDHVAVALGCRWCRKS